MIHILMLQTEKEVHSTYDLYIVDARPSSPSPVWPATEGEMPNARVCCSTGYASSVVVELASHIPSSRDGRIATHSGPFPDGFV